MTQSSQQTVLMNQTIIDQFNNIEQVQNKHAEYMQALKKQLEEVDKRVLELAKLVDTVSGLVSKQGKLLQKVSSKQGIISSRVSSSNTSFSSRSERSSSKGSAYRGRGRGNRRGRRGGRRGGGQRGPRSRSNSARPNKGRLNLLTPDEEEKFRMANKDIKQKFRKDPKDWEKMTIAQRSRHNIELREALMTLRAEKLLLVKKKISNNEMENEKPN